MQKKYLVYRIANGFFANAAAAHKFIVYIFRSQYNTRADFKPMNLKRPQATINVIQRMRPKYKGLNVEYYLVNEREYNKIKEETELFGFYRSTHFKPLDYFLSEDEVEYPVDLIHIKDFYHFLTLRDTYDIVNNKIDYTTPTYQAIKHIKDAYKLRGEL